MDSTDLTLIEWRGTTTADVCISADSWNQAISQLHRAPAARRLTTTTTTSQGRGEDSLPPPPAAGATHTGSSSNNINSMTLGNSRPTSNIAPPLVAHSVRPLMVNAPFRAHSMGSLQSLEPPKQRRSFSNPSSACTDAVRQQIPSHEKATVPSEEPDRRVAQCITTTPPKSFATTATTVPATTPPPKPQKQCPHCNMWFHHLDAHTRLCSVASPRHCPHVNTETGARCYYVTSASPKEFDLHVASCPLRLTQCPNANHGCTKRISVSCLSEHLAKCTFETARCSHCLSAVPRLEKVVHEEQCGEALVLCPLHCGRHFQRKMVSAHIQRTWWTHRRDACSPQRVPAEHPTAVVQLLLSILLSERAAHEKSKQQQQASPLHQWLDATQPAAADIGADEDCSNASIAFESVSGRFEMTKRPSESSRTPPVVPSSHQREAQSTRTHAVTPPSRLAVDDTSDHCAGGSHRHAHNNRHHPHHLPLRQHQPLSSHTPSATTQNESVELHFEVVTATTSASSSPAFVMVGDESSSHKVDDQDEREGGGDGLHQLVAVHDGNNTHDRSSSTCSFTTDITSMVVTPLVQNSLRKPEEVPAQSIVSRCEDEEEVHSSHVGQQVTDSPVVESNSADQDPAEKTVAALYYKENRNLSPSSSPSPHSSVGEVDGRITKTVKSAVPFLLPAADPAMDAMDTASAYTLVEGEVSHAISSLKILSNPNALDGLDDEEIMQIEDQVADHVQALQRHIQHWKARGDTELSRIHAMEVLWSDLDKVSYHWKQSVYAKLYL